MFVDDEDDSLDSNSRMFVNDRLDSNSRMFADACLDSSPPCEQPKAKTKQTKTDLEKHKTVI